MSAIEGCPFHRVIRKAMVKSNGGTYSHYFATETDADILHFRIGI